MNDQILETRKGTDKIVIGYAPDAKGSIMKDSRRLGTPIFKSEQDLLYFLESLNKK